MDYSTAMQTAKRYAIAANEMRFVIRDPDTDTVIRECLVVRSEDLDGYFAQSDPIGIAYECGELAELPD